MYRSASNRPQQLFRQLITTSLTAGSLLFLPLIGAASTYNESTDIEETVPLQPSQTYTISEGVTVSSSLADDDLFIAPGGDFGGSANTPNFTNYGTLTHVRDDYSEGSATFRISASNFSFTNATTTNATTGNVTTGKITIGKNYPTTGTWSINGFDFSGTGGTLTNEGDIEGRGDLTVVLGGSNNTVTNSGTLRTPLTNGFTPTDSWFYRAIENKGSKNSLTNSGTIEAYYEPVYNSGSNFTLYNAAGGLINAAADYYAILDYGDNTEVTNDGALSAINFTYRVVGGNANTLVNSGTISSDNFYAYRVTGGADNATLSNTGVIEAANNYGVGFWDSTNITVTNAGTVKAGSEYAAYFSNDEGVSVTNSGNIEAGINTMQFLSGKDITLTNTGTITGNDTDDSSQATSLPSNTIRGEGVERLAITNSSTGTISAAGAYSVYSNGIGTIITNKGSISAGGWYGIRIESPGANADITNSGTISSPNFTYRVYGFSDNTLVNSGTISSTNRYAYRVTNGSENVALSNENTGVIEAVNSFGVGFWDSTNISVTNAGTVKTGSNYAAYLSNDEDVSIVNSGKIEAGEDTVTILGGKNISLTNTGSITSNGTVAISAQDVEGLTLNLSGTITGEVNHWSGSTAPDTYTPTVTLNNLTLDGDLKFQNYDSSGTTWSQVSKLPTEKSSEQVALEEKIQALEEALQVYAPSKKDGAVPEPLTADLSKEEILERASHAVREEDSQEQREKEMQLRTDLRQLQSELDTLTEAEVDKAAAVPHDTSTGVGSASLSVGAVTFSDSSTISITDSSISLLTGYKQGSIPFSSESSGNSLSVGSGEDVRVVGLSPAANTITIAGTVGYITTPEGGSYTANLTQSGSIRAVELGGTAAEPVNLTIKTTGSDDEGASTTASAALSQVGASPLSLQVVSDNVDNTLTFDSGQGTPYCLSLLGSSLTHNFVDQYGQEVTYYRGQMASFGADNCHTFVAANAGLLDARYDKLSDKIINLDHKLQDGNTDWLFEVRYQDHRKNEDDNQPHANSTILALSKLWHTTRGDWIFQASNDSMHIGQHLNNNSASIVLGHSQNWGKTSELHMQLGGDRREMSLDLVGDQETVRESSNYSIVYGEIGMGRVLHKLAGHDINMRMRLAAERIGSIGKGWDSDTIALMIPELSVSGRVLPSLLTDASHRLYAFAQKPIGDTKQKYTITGHSESTLYYDTDVSGGIGYDLHTGVGANTMLHAKASYLNTGYLSLGLGISQNL